MKTEITQFPDGFRLKCLAYRNSMEVQFGSGLFIEIYEKSRKRSNNKRINQKVLLTFQVTF